MRTWVAAFPHSGSGRFDEPICQSLCQGIGEICALTYPGVHDGFGDACFVGDGVNRNAGPLTTDGPFGGIEHMLAIDHGQSAHWATGWASDSIGHRFIAPNIALPQMRQRRLDYAWQ